jgi:hypothetical protein
MSHLRKFNNSETRRNAGNTDRNFYYGFLRWTKWTKLQGISDADVLPAKPIHVALYLTCLVEQNSSSGPINDWKINVLVG